MSWRQIEGENDVGLNTEKPSALTDFAYITSTYDKKVGRLNAPWFNAHAKNKICVYWLGPKCL